MGKIREHQWQAYLDGELTATEASEFEATLSPEEREQLADELKFERAMAARLREEGECPSKLWANTLQLLEQQYGVSPSAKRKWYWGAASLAAAAAIAFVLSIYGPSLTPLDDTGPIFAASSVKDLVAESEIEPGYQSTADFLTSHGIDVVLYRENRVEALSRPHQPIRFVGARALNGDGDDATEIMMTCCGRPVRIIVAEQDSATGERMANAIAQPGNDVQAIRIVNGYMTAVVSKHPAAKLAGILEAKDVHRHEARVQLLRKKRQLADH